MTWNANSLNNKYHNTSAMLERRRPTVIAIQETMRRRRRRRKPVFQSHHGSDDGDHSSIRIGRYSGIEHRIASNSSGKHVRGLAILIDNRAPSLRLQRLQLGGVEKGRMIFGRISGFTSGKSLIIGNVYIPPGMKSKSMAAITQAVGRIRQKFNNDEIIIVGDWNYRFEPLVKKLSTMEKHGINETSYGQESNDIPQEGMSLVRY
jgi:exonuclease III